MTVSPSRAIHDVARSRTINGYAPPLGLSIVSVSPSLRAPGLLAARKRLRVLTDNVGRPLFRDPQRGLKAPRDYSATRSKTPGVRQAEASAGTFPGRRPGILPAAGTPGCG